MRGIVSEKLKPFLAQVAIAAEQAKQDGLLITPQLTRDNLAKLSAFMGQGPQIELIKDSSLITPTHDIATRIYHPYPDQSLPVILHFHGGGHMCGSIELYDPISRELALQTQCIVITIDYRLAPEFPYPCGIEDGQFALENYQQLLSGLNYSDQLLIAGDSAGAAICSTLVMNNIDNGALSIDKQILIYPSVDYSLTCSSITENGHGFLLETAKINWYFDHYFQQFANDKEFVLAASPLHGKFSPNMPKTLVITAGCDPLRDEGIAYVQALRAADVKVTHHQFDQMIHAYMLLNNLVESEYAQTFKLIKKFVTN